MLTEDHKRQRLDSSHEFFRRYADEMDNVLDSIVTGGETSTYLFNTWNETTITSVAAFLLV